jgi:hypothetical protein
MRLRLVEPRDVLCRLKAGEPQRIEQGRHMRRIAAQQSQNESVRWRHGCCSLRFPVWVLWRRQCHAAIYTWGSTKRRNRKQWRGHEQRIPSAQDFSAVVGEHSTTLRALYPATSSMYRERVFDFPSTCELRLKCGDGVGGGGEKVDDDDLPRSYDCTSTRQRETGRVVCAREGRKGNGDTAADVSPLGRCDVRRRVAVRAERIQ